MGIEEGYSQEYEFCLIHLLVLKSLSTISFLKFRRLCSNYLKLNMSLSGIIGRCKNDSG